MIHTPTPWKALNNYRILGNQNGPNEGDSDVVVCDMMRNGGIPTLEWKANAAFIVTACNAYDRDQETIRELVAALEYLWWHVDNRMKHLPLSTKTKIRAALAHAKQEEVPA